MQRIAKKSISGLYFNLNMYELTFYFIWTVPIISKISLWFVLNTFQQRYLCAMELWRNYIIFKVVNVKQIQVSVYFTLHNNNCHPAPCCNPDCCSHMFHTTRWHPFWLTIKVFPAPGAVFYSVLTNCAVFHSVTNIYQSLNLWHPARCFILC